MFSLKQLNLQFNFLFIYVKSMASQHSHVAKVIEHAAANPKSLKSGESAALQAAASFVGSGPGPSMPLLPAPKVWHEALSPEGYSYYWNVETNGNPYC